MPKPNTLKIPAFARVSDYVGPWLIEESRAASLIRLAQSTDLMTHVRQTVPEPLQADYEIVTAGTSANPKQIATIRLQGLLMKSVSSMGSNTSTVATRRAIRQAASDPNISGILLVIDSPGGTSAGTEDLANEIKSANARKPVIAYVEDLCASAAYFAASQCEQVFANNPQAFVGSIGTLMVMYDMSQAAEREGIEAVVFSTGSMKGAGTPGSPITAEQRDKYQQLINDSQRGFDAAVKAGRKLTTRQLEAVRTGEVWTADKAMTLGLIDGIRTFEQAVSAVVSAAKQRSAKPSTATQKGESMTFQQWAAAKGVNLSTLTPDQMASAEMAYEFDREMGFGAFNQPAKPAVGQQDLVQSIRESSAKEFSRIATIQNVAAKYKVKAELVEQAIRQGTDAKDFELESMRGALAGNSIAPINPQAQRELNSQMYEAAICIAGNMSHDKLVRRFPEQCLETARKEFGTSLSLQELLLTSARQNGYHGRQAISQGNLREVLQFAMPMQSGFSSFSLPGILSNVANKFLLDGYQSGEENWRLLTRQRSANDFKTMTSYRMIGAFKFEEVGPDGEIKHGRTFEQSFTNRVKTFANMYSITRQDIINDDLNALSGVPTELGRGAIDKLNEVFWTLFLNPAAGFYITSAVTTTGAQMAVNSLSGAGSALGVTGLTAARSAFTKQIKPDGTPVMVMPRFLVVPPELLDSATILLRDRELRDNTANKNYVAANPHAGVNMQIVTSPYMSNSAYTGNSAAAWYLMADPAQLPGFEVAFLNGQQTPIIEQSEAEFDTLGIAMRGYFDFGVGQLDGRSAVKNAGS